ncbi:MAG: hypothetical protein UT08_C0003G0119 [Candidatus Woesebacteria bacterium GW2011_GWB1_38_8]|uniref:HD domain-containing protein n=1 Tax=Candidatus Woesebacteria bacterium GW2011_GWB1_38_8 TaxID=1618570 RepID=A0A0G0P9F3_9BACT|nr:MAG: hypothetical protein UT08_C0003G0119 [Candidatus Woesebacteria bacterium GW2011_GWB1_38_8]
MLLELSNRIADIFPPLRDKPDTVSKVVEVLEGNMWTGLDFPHQLHHNLRVYRDSQCISALRKVDPWERDFLEKGALVHDLGRNFVEMGLIEENEHQNASFVLAKTIAMVEWGFTDWVASYFAEGVALHTEDVLPRGTHRWIRILRDSDRTSRLGMGGAFELAWYLGYRDDYIDRSPAEQLINDGLIFDLDISTSFEQVGLYDQKPRQYFDKKVLPWLKENQKMDDLIEGIAIFISRVKGVPNIKNKKPRWIVEPVSKTAQFLSEPRILSTNRFLVENGYVPEGNNYLFLYR